MEQKSNGTLREALTFDDVLLKPGLSELLPSDADIRSRITRAQMRRARRAFGRQARSRPRRERPRAPRAA